MGKQIIKQPNGQYAIFSSIVDNFIYTDCSKYEVLDLFMKEASKRAKEETLAIIDKLDKGEKPYYQFTMTYDEALELIAYDREPGK